MTEATSNAHTYVITVVSGAGAFAPVAFAALLWRPVSVCVSALTPPERACMVKEISRRGGGIPVQSVTAFSLMVLFATILTALAILGGATFFPNLVLVIGETSTTPAIASFGFVMLVRCVREPLGVLLQAQGRFKELTLVTLVTSLMSLVFVVGIVIVGYPQLSVIGVGISEACLSIILTVLAFRGRNSHG